MSSEPTKKRGFAAMTPERMREIASSGGVARKKAFDQSRQNGKSKRMAGQPMMENPGVPKASPSGEGV